MKKLLGVVVLCLMLSGNAYSEKVFLNCEFINGSLDDLKNNTSEKIDYSEDVTIDLDLKKNKVLDGPHLGADSNPFIYDDEDEISWQHQFGTTDNGMLHSVNLNRRNGGLTIWTLINLKPNQGSAIKHYKCVKVEKKLF